MRTLLIVPGNSQADSADHAGTGPTPHHVALANSLRAHGNHSVEILDYDSAADDDSRQVRMARRVGGPDAALAMIAYRRASEHDCILSFGEGVAVPLATLLKPLRRRPGHVCVTSRLSAVRRRLFFTALKVQSAVDMFFVYSEVQRDFAEDRLGIPSEKLALISYPVDDVFYRAQAHAVVNPRQICAVGWDRRDYPTLQEAAQFPAGMSVVLAVRSSQWRRDHQSISLIAPEKHDIPARDNTGIRDLYSESLIVAVPLRECNYEAGVHTIVEAMAMGRPIVATQTLGQTDAICDGVTGLTVLPGDVVGWRRAIDALRHDEDLRERLGRNARRWVEVNATLDRWVSRIADALRDAAEEAARTGSPDPTQAAFEGVW